MEDTTLAPDEPVRSAEFVQSLERGLAVIRAFDARRPSLTLSEVAKETGLSRAAARRFLLTLVELGYVGTDGREFALRPRVLELGHAYLSSLSLPEIAEPHIKRLATEVGESTSVAVLDGQDIVYVGRYATYRIMSASIRVGTRFPAFATSMGRAILGSLPDAEREAFLATVELPELTPHTVRDVGALRAELARVPEQGYALVDQELEEGLRSIAAPLRDASGAVVAAVNVSAPVRRGDVAEILADILPALKRAASDIEADLERTGVRVR
ncbi:IclR family transcriptional regulator [Protaetiibacter intestinalis]|uniref:Glycerol operon regulatory protein n=2 Tax=Protaetiibacter intestinalis TaxID=2419774 RepID=A0A387BI52_9MICO|nr:IclR family transcriptional regulator [Protaetiibacter intestinalis]